ncbi:LysR family transcriptional regulator [Gordonia malaquae]|uniref:LysR family transcriptional regulator n=1 Tax=Gordonia malaquae TaxID=410332 RepID=UPI003015E65E
MTSRQPTMHQVNVQQIECLITLADELHFGRTAERLGYSQSRVSQLIAQLEHRVGARLVERTSRRVALTRIGEQFVDEVTPAYAGLLTTFQRARDRAMRGALEELRIGFSGMVYEQVTAAFLELRTTHGVRVHSVDLPLGSPFTALLAGDVDGAIVELPAEVDRLVVGFEFPAQDRLVAVGREHAFADRDEIDVEELACLDMLHRDGDAPEHWKMVHTPIVTPNGLPIVSTTGVTSMQQGLVLAATGDHAMLVCRAYIEYNQRSDVRFIPVRGLEGTSRLGLLWRADAAAPQLAALAELLATTVR